MPPTLTPCAGSGTRRTLAALRIVLIDPLVRSAAAGDQKPAGQRRDMLDGARGLFHGCIDVAGGADGKNASVRCILEAGHQQPLTHPLRFAHVGTAAQDALEMAVATQEDLCGAAIADVGQHRQMFCTRRGRKPVFGHVRIMRAKHHPVMGGWLPQRVMHQRRIELAYRLPRRRQREAHVGKAAGIGIPGQRLRSGAAARVRQRVAERLAAAYIQHVDGGQFAAAHGRAVGQIAPVRRGPERGNGGVAFALVEIDQHVRLAAGPGLRHQHGLRLRWRLAQVEQRAAGQVRCVARGGRDGQRAHPSAQRLAHRHGADHRLGMRVLRLDPALHGRRVGMFQPAIGIVHADAVHLRAGCVPGGGRRRRIGGPCAVGYAAGKQQESGGKQT